MDPEQLRQMYQKVQTLPPDEMREFINKASPQVQHLLRWSWEMKARPEQLLPPQPWTYWLILAGRGFGKTRTGAETVRMWARSFRFINLIGATSDDAKDIMIEGESGILAVCPKDERPYYKKHERKLEWPNGAMSLIFTADEPERLRGKQHEKLWGDELGAWRYPEAWDQAKFGLRLGASPQALITTTPRPTKIMRELVRDPNCHVTKGSTYDNKQNLAPAFFTEIIKKYENTRLGRQELNAELLEDTPGALWRQRDIDSNRASRETLPDMMRVVIAIDPAVSSEDNSNETGIVAVALDDEKHGYLLADESGVYTPDEWAKTALSLFHRFQADRIVAEKNQGGDMVESIIKAQMHNAPVTLVHASRGKYTRAEPVAALYEQQRVSHVDKFDRLEDQMCAFTPDFDTKKQGYSPDRVDALVWGFTFLFPQIVKTNRRNRVRHQPKQRFFA